MIRRLHPPGAPDALGHSGGLRRRPGLCPPQGVRDAATAPAGTPPAWVPQQSGRLRRPRAPLRCRKKRKMEPAEEAEPDDCPAGKKRLIEAAAPRAGPEWILPAGPTLGRATPAHGLDRLPGPLEMPYEEMEQAMGEQPGEVAHRRLREIEARIIDDGDDDDDSDDGLAEGSVSNMPTLVLSDTLKTGLKRDYQEVLTRKIIECMSRPSMELVLWKPLPEFLTERARPVSVKNYEPVGAERDLVRPAALEAAFHTQTFPEQRQQAEMPSGPHYSAVGPSGGADEEMEL